jgi:ribosomal-protein-alanine N-acetyltransferase
VTNPRAARSGEPTLETERLILRPFQLTDAADVQRLAGDRAIADTTATIPHPYPNGAAEASIASHADHFASGESVTFAITHRDNGALRGAIGLELRPEHRRAELGYWVGKPFWNRGYTTEAARAVIRYAFQCLTVDRIFAHHFLRNPASERVMHKIGMRPEGILRRHLIRWGVPEDLGVCGILRDDWQESG